MALKNANSNISYNFDSYNCISYNFNSYNCDSYNFDSYNFSVLFFSNISLRYHILGCISCIKYQIKLYQNTVLIHIKSDYISSYIETPKYQKNVLNLPFFSNWCHLTDFDEIGHLYWPESFWCKFYTSYLQFIFWKIHKNIHVAINLIKFKTIGRFSGFRFEDFLEIRLYESKLYETKNYMSRK